MSRLVSVGLGRALFNAPISPVADAGRRVVASSARLAAPRSLGLGTKITTAGRAARGFSSRQFVSPGAAHRLLPRLQFPGGPGVAPPRLAVAVRRLVATGGKRLGTATLGQVSRGLPAGGSTTAELGAAIDASGRLVGYWVGGVAAAVFGMVAVGGYTRSFGSPDQYPLPPASAILHPCSLSPDQTYPLNAVPYSL